MAVTSGFYNSVKHDRRYSSVQMAMLFDGLICDGVYASIGDALVVKASSGMTVNVGSGRCWFNHSWTLNDAELPITIDSADVVLSRIDAIVVEINGTQSVRENTIKVVKGTAASQNVVRPALTKSGGVYQYPLCYIAVNANASFITQADITNMIGTSECPFVTGILETIDTDELVTQWQSRFEQLFSELESQIEQTVAGTIIDGSVTEEKIAENAVSTIYRTTVLNGAWLEGDGDYYQTLTVAGVLETDEPSFDIDLSSAKTVEEALKIVDANSIYRVITQNGSIQVRATDAADVDIPIKIRCIRK